MNQTETSAPRRTRSAAILAWLRLARVFQKIDRQTTEVMRGHDLSVAQFDVLAHVGAADGQTQQQLADSLLVTKGNICQLLDRMEHAGLLQRCQQGRANRVHLTDCGRKLFDVAVPAQETAIERALGALTLEEQQTLLDLLRKLDRSLA